MDSMPPEDSMAEAIPMKIVLLIDYPEGGKDVYLEWVRSVAPTLQAFEEVRRIRSYDNQDPTMSPNRLVEYEFDSFLEMAAYLNRPEIVKIMSDLPNHASDVSLYTFIQRSDYSKTDEGNWQVKSVLLVDYPLGGKQAYLDWVESVSSITVGPTQLKTIASYDNYYGETPHRLVEFEFANQEEADAYAALEEIMLRLYGPEATGQLRRERISSRTFAELNSLLNGTADSAVAEALEEEILNADWLIFAMLDVDVANYDSSDAVKRFLRQRGDRLPGSKLVVLALNEPYFFDSTEIGKMTAFLGVYSKTQPFLEAAVRALFRAQTVTGAPPVSVPGTRFSNLVERLEPDPDQRIDLTVLNEDIVIEQTEDDELELIQTDLKLGDSLELQAGPILDRNGNTVPDGTPVNFRLIYEGEELAIQSNPVPTRGGLARKSVILERTGILLIAVNSVEANSSKEFQARIPDPDVASDRTQIEVTNPERAATPAPTQAAPATAVPTTDPVATPIAEVNLEAVEVDVASLTIAMVTQLVVLALLLVVLVQVMPRQLLVKRLLWAMLVGWGAYILYGVDVIPGGVWIQINLAPWDSVPIVVAGMLIPLVWLRFRTE